MAANASKISRKSDMTLKDKIFYFWSEMDVLAIVLYYMNSIRHGRIPIVSDVMP